MRVLFSVWPMTAHLYPVVPLASALQGAGHEVCVTSTPDLSGAITAAGLQAVALGDAGTLPSLSSAGEYMLGEPERAALAEALGIGPADATSWTMFSLYTLASIRMFHSGQPCPGVDDLVAFAGNWRPDLIVWDMTWPGAAIAARVTGAAHARLLWGPDYCAWGRERSAGVDDPLAATVRPAAERLGVEVDDELLLGQWTIDPTPPQVRLATGVRSVPMRRVPYTGAAVVPAWLYPRPERPRVALSLGSSGRLFHNNRELIAALLAMVSDLDVEVVATFDATQLDGQTVPANVRTIDYLPLNLLLPTCSAVIHHGGGGTMAAAVAQRLPQLIIAGEGVESPAYERYLLDRGAGLVVDHRRHSVDEMAKRLTRVLTEPGFAEGARRLYADWLAMPSPADIVPLLEKLAAEHRG